MHVESISLCVRFVPVLTEGREALQSDLKAMRLLRMICNMQRSRIRRGMRVIVGPLAHDETNFTPIDQCEPYWR